MPSTFCKSCFGNLALDSRMEIFLFLKAHNSATVSQIVEHLHLSQPTISYHLRNMNEAGLLSKKRMGKAIYYAVNETCPNSHQQCSFKQMNFAN